MGKNIFVWTFLEKLESFDAGHKRISELEHYRQQSGQILGKMTHNQGRPDPVQSHGMTASGGHAEDYKAKFYEKLL